MAPADTESAWSFLTVDDGRRQHRGNEGYDDQPEKYYSWDSTVPNHGGPAEGDLCLVRDSRGALGVSWIDDISQTEAVPKPRLRCPECHSTALKRRTNLKPLFRCSRCFFEFDRPAEELIEVTVYRADYERSWWQIGGAITASELEEVAYLSHAKQQAIRPIEPKALESLFVSRHVLIGRRWWKSGVVLDAPPIGGGFNITESKSRIGQDKFRRRLLERFGPVCAFSGPQPEESLHAAHLNPYAESPQHDLAGGLLLRADLHSLFDRRLIAIDEGLRIRVDDSLRPYAELRRLDGLPLRIDSSDPLLPTLRKLLKKIAEKG